MRSPVPASGPRTAPCWLGFPSHADPLGGGPRAGAGRGRRLGARLAIPAASECACWRPPKASIQPAPCWALRASRSSGRFGDIWLRDTGPIFADGEARVPANAGGGKYELEFDDQVAGQIASASGAGWSPTTSSWRAGRWMTGSVRLPWQQCLLNPNHNPGWTEAVAEAALAEALGARKVLWLDDGLARDHTDGHVDNLARFVAPRRWRSRSPSGPTTPTRRSMTPPPPRWRR